MLRVRCILNIQVGMSGRQSEGQANDVCFGFSSIHRDWISPSKICGVRKQEDRGLSLGALQHDVVRSNQQKILKKSCMLGKRKSRRAWKHGSQMKEVFEEVRGLSAILKMRIENWFSQGNHWWPWRYQFPWSCRWWRLVWNVWQSSRKRDIKEGDRVHPLKIFIEKKGREIDH